MFGCVCGCVAVECFGYGCEGLLASDSVDGRVTFREDLGLAGGRCGISLGKASDFFAMLADVMRSDVGIELANGREGDVAHDGVAKLAGEDAESFAAGGVVEARDVLGENFASQGSEGRCVMAGVRAGDGLPADDVERTLYDGVTVAQRIVSSIFVEDAGKEPGREVGAVGFIEETTPGVGIEAWDTLPREGWELRPSAVREVRPRKRKVE
jgi:hypothetical protein